MGAVGGLLGISGGAGGTGFAGPSSAEITNPVDMSRMNTGFKNTNDSMTAQNNLLAALQGQNGLAHQNQVYNQIQGVANGTGPNPAQAMLNQSTGQNVANQAALMAGQRGAGANVGLMARLAAQQGANTQQQAVGQGATMQANQSLNAIGQAGQMANNQVGNQIGQTNANTQAQQNNQQQLLNSIQGVNNSNVGMQSNINNANASMANTMMGGQQGMIGGAMQGAAMAAMMADGGEVGDAFAGNGPQSKFGQYITGSIPNAQASPDIGSVQAADTAGAKSLQEGSSKLAGALSKPSTKPPGMAVAGGGDGLMGGAGAADLMVAAEGGKVPALVSPGERFLKPDEVKKVAQGEESPLQAGEKIPGQPKYPGNDYRNDVVPKDLEVGGLVIPNKVLQSKNAKDEAMKFVEAHLHKMAKGGEVKLEPHQEGVHRQSGVSGNGHSIAGNMVREGDMKGAKASHEHKLEQLRQMPKPKLMADGGEADDPSVEADLVPAEGDRAPAEVPQEPQQQAEAPKPIENMSPSEQVNSEVGGAPIAQGDKSPVAGSLDEDSDYQKSYQDFFQEHKTQLAQQNAAFDQDLANGHIQPKTYHDLYANKSTLGKIGSLFGMLVGSAGAGLSHQPNAILGMMDKEIERDLQAQQHSKDNAQNFLRINQQAVPTRAAAQALAYSQMLQTSMHSLMETTKNMPEATPEQRAAKQARMQAIGYMSNKIGEKINNLNDLAAAQDYLLNGGHLNGSGAAKSVKPQSPGQQNSTPVNYQKLNDLDRRAKFGDPRVSATDVANATEEARKVEPMRSFRNNFNSAFQELNAPGAGKLSPNRRSSLIESLAGDYSKITGYGADAAHAKMEALLPKVTDWNKTTQEEKLRNNNSMFDTLEAGVPTLKRFGLLNNYQAPSVKGSAPKQQQFKIVNGVKYKRGPKGEAIKVQ